MVKIMDKEIVRIIENKLKNVKKQLTQSQDIMVKSIIGLCSVILTHLHNEDYEKAKDSLVSLIIQLEARSEDA